MKVVSFETAIIERYRRRESSVEDKARWISFFQWLRGRGLDGVKLIVGGKCLGMLEAVGEVFPDAKYQRCNPLPHRR